MDANALAEATSPTRLAHAIRLVTLTMSGVMPAACMRASTWFAVPTFPDRLQASRSVLNVTTDGWTPSLVMRA